MATPTKDPSSFLPGIVPRFNNISISDTFWLIGFFTSIVAVVIALIVYVLIITRFFCRQKLNNSSKKDDLLTKLSATVSATFSLLCIILVFTTFPVCTIYPCEYNLIGNLYYSSVLDTYVLSKLAVYTLFIDRIYNDYFTKIYCYSSRILYLLLTMIIIVIISLIMFNILCIFNFHMYFGDFISETSVIVFILMDLTFSGITLFLFLKPIYNQTDKQQNKQYMKHKIVKYALLSSLAIVSSLIYELSYAIRIFTGLYHSKSNKTNDYMDISSILQIIDCVISMFCVFFGFVDRHIFDKYCKKCHQCFTGIHWSIIEKRKRTMDKYNYERKPTALRDLYKKFLDKPQSETCPYGSSTEDTSLSVHITSDAEVDKGMYYDINY